MKFRTPFSQALKEIHTPLRPERFEIPNIETEKDAIVSALRRRNTKLKAVNDILQAN